MTSKTISLVAVAILIGVTLRATPDTTGTSSVQPSPSPDGTRLAFASDHDGGNNHIFTSTIDGHDLKQLTFSVPLNDGESSDNQPAWSPTGTEILFASDRSGRRDIWGILPDGGAPRQLTQNAGDNDSPTWSPTASLIAFVSTRGGTADIWTIAVDGTNLRRVTTLPGQENHPSFSPNGAEIVFSETVNGASTLMIVPVAGGTPRALTTGTSRDWDPSWSSFGIAFSSNRSGKFMAWTIKADGTALKQVSNVPAWDPVWTPTGSIFFTRESNGSNIFSLNPTSGSVQQVTTVEGFHVEVTLTPSTNRAIAVNGADPIQVAALSTTKADMPSIVDRTSLSFGRTGHEASLLQCDAPSDQNGDGLPDLVCWFAANRTGLTNSDTEAIWRGLNKTGSQLEGRITVKVSGGK